MNRKVALLGGMVLVAFTIVSAAPTIGSAFAQNCSATDKINGTTADDAKKRMEAAGYAQVQDLRKGCDNAWHGSAIKDGTRVNVVWNAEGAVLTEGN